MSYGSAAGQISSLQIDRYVGSGQRVCVPVQPSQTVFAQYRHITGTPAGSNQNTVPLSKVRLLNSLIDNLQKMNKDTSLHQASAESSPARTDALIRQYAGELHKAVTAAPQPFGTMGGVSGSGMVYQVSA